jgi:two-component system OmpR family response regulator
MLPMPTPATAPIAKVLFAEDDARLAKLTTEYLEGHGFAVTWIDDGERALAEALSGRHDVVLLDVMLPRRSGLEICRELRGKSSVPIVLLTARGEEADRVLGLELGADDYVPKPFSPRELVARLSGLLRRSRGQTGPGGKILRAGRLTLDPSARSAEIDGKPLSLTSAEFSLLQVLIERAGRVLSREQLLELSKGAADEAFDRAIDVQISRLRQKLGDDARKPRLLKTVRGAGYLLSAEEPEP